MSEQQDLIEHLKSGACSCNRSEQVLALIDSLLSERDEARNNALEEAALVADDYIDTLTRRGMSERPAFEIAQALRAMRGKRTARLNDMKVGDEIEWKDGAP